MSINKYSLNTFKLPIWLTPHLIIVAIGIVVCFALSLAIPNHMIEPDDWVYYYGAKNFSQGNLVVDDQLHFQQVDQAWQQGGFLVQYVKIGENKWALEKAPGYVFFLVPFELIGVPQVGNLMLAIGLVIVTYILLKRLRDEKAACIGSLLMLFTPVSLIMLHRTYMDSFAASSFLAIGGGLYFYYCLKPKTVRSPANNIILFVAFLFISYSVVVRYTNILIAAALAIHFAVFQVRSYFHNENRSFSFDIASCFLGIVLPASLLFFYNKYVFGSAFDYGYQYSDYATKFAFQYFGSVYPTGQSIPLEIIKGNLRNIPLPLLLGFPLLVIAIPGLGIILYHKISACKKSGKYSEVKSDLGAGLPLNLLIIIIGWIIFVFPLYMLYEWTATIQEGTSPFIVLTRFYLPGLLPITILAALVISRFSFKFMVATMMIAVLIGSGLYIHSATRVEPTPLLGSPPGILQQQQKELIDHTREDVKETITDGNNIQVRFAVLEIWIPYLASRGYPMEFLPQPKQIQRINQLIESGDITQASILVDQTYRSLEEMVGG